LKSAETGNEKSEETTEMHIPVIRNVLEANEKMADAVRKRLLERGILALNLISSPGAGKTSLLERTLRDLTGKFRMAVIEGDLQTSNDAERVAATGAQAVQINTEGGCHLNSAMISRALDELSLDDLDILFIENVGNLVCPVEFDCGEDAKIALLSVAEGDDKPEKYPLLFNLAKVMILNKIDLLPHVDFDLARARAFASKLNGNLEIFELSCRDGQGLEQWYRWLGQAREAKKHG
jgi:hydrogenase nickel incorporation protein HypB